MPMYGGYREGSMKAARLLEWYGGTGWRGILEDTALGDAGVILALTVVVSMMSAGICAALCRRLFLGEGRG